MSETNPAPSTTPPPDPSTTPPPPAAPPAPPAPPTPPATPPANLPGADLFQRLETVLQGLPERTANAVREASPQHVPNPTAPPGSQPPAQQGGNGGEKQTGGPGRAARWFFGIK